MLISIPIKDRTYMRMYNEIVKIMTPDPCLSPKRDSNFNRKIYTENV